MAARQDKINQPAGSPARRTAGIKTKAAAEPTDGRYWRFLGYVSAAPSVVFPPDLAVWRLGVECRVFPR